MYKLNALVYTSATLMVLLTGILSPAKAQTTESQSLDDNSETLESESLGDSSNTFVAQAALEAADENGWYVSLGPSLIFDYPIDIDSDGPVAVTTAPLVPGGPAVVTNIPIDISLDTETGFGINGAVGYRFDDARVELEVAYTNNDVESITVNDLDEISLDGEIESTQFMVTGYYDIPTNSRFSPYIGGGVGIATLTADDIETDIPGLGLVALDDTGTSFVFQVKAGVGYQISRQANIFLGYRLHGIPGQDFEVFDTDFDADTFLVHSLQLGARYEF
ncbi:hypothetical protein N836_33185 [Leptolyngbya sp. Heron Island J]|uniref:P44/Msp2 family outer membrane protein n=1 Tax=Leptolyngbya sp. Heron Island J TaxID=1385935 RepID=UPI0003B952C8|nr:P44/Msp2 family outer membrane protein [Leptolyngbya sp. Heron Island J]ESA38285.1 hypothetical protein N836_33185 [Leptolyngbya sp. Heron Island J]